MVLHCIPLEAFVGTAQYDVRPLYDNPIPLTPMGTTNWDRRLNLDGVLAFGTQQPCPSYTQLYRNGVMEVVQGRILAHEYEGRMVIPSVSYERHILDYLPRCFRLVEVIGANVPVVVALTLLKTTGLYMGVDNLSGHPGYPIDSDSLVLPEVIVDSFATSSNQVLKPLFDLIWNACGLPSSTNFDADGNWIARR